MDLLYNQFHIDIQDYDLKHDMLYVDHKIQYKDLDIFHWCMQDSKDILHLKHIQVDNLVVYQYNLVDRNMLRYHEYHDIENLVRKEMVHKDFH